MATPQALFWIAAILVQFLCPLASADNSRIALVVGNADYATGPLKNPVNDARAMAKTLRGLDFEVIEKENLDFFGLVEAIRDFTVRSRGSQVRLFYFAGHGVQVKGRNYLIPVDTRIAGEDEFPRKSADLGDLLDRLGDLTSGLNIVILDACRLNPFKRGLLRGAAGKSGLARTEPPRGTIIAYATAPGAVTLDTGKDPNSVYTKHLLANLSTPGQTVERLFKKVYASVSSETNQAQRPWLESAFSGEFCFKPDSDNRCGMD